MKFIPFFKMLFNGRALAMFLVIKSTSGLCRSTFVSTGISEGIYKRLAQGPAGLDELLDMLGPGANSEGFESWLNLGVKLKELRLDSRGYSLRGWLSKILSKPKHDSVAALLSELVLLYHEIVIKTPSMLRQNKEFDNWEKYGELIARSSRMLEGNIFPYLDEVIPSTGQFRMLEVGCGSGTYMRHACMHNKELTSVGLELQEDVARFAEKNIEHWNIADRVTIQAIDVREFNAEEGFDLVTLHNNIYYFPTDTRAELAEHLLTCLKPGGHLIVTSGCQGGSAGMEYLNLFCIMTKGYDGLPYPDQLEAQLKQAGFETVICKWLVPRAVDSMCMFIAQKPV